MIPLSGPSRTKNVPITEVAMHTAPIASGSKQRISDCRVMRRHEKDRDEQHRRDDRDGISLEQIGRHARAVADIVADIVGDDSRVARVVLRDPGFDLADEVGADIGALGENTAAEAGKDRDQRGAETQPDHRLEHRAQIVSGRRRAQDEVVDRRRQAGQAPPPRAR